MREQLTYGYRAASGDEPRSPLLDRVVEPQAALFDEPEDERRDERLRDAADAETQSFGHRQVAVHGGHAARLDTRGATIVNEHERAGRAFPDDPVEQSAEVLVLTRAGDGPARRQDCRCAHEGAGRAQLTPAQCTWSCAHSCSSAVRAIATRTGSTSPCSSSTRSSASSQRS